MAAEDTPVRSEDQRALVDLFSPPRYIRCLMSRTDTTVVIMAGGSGTRFWPASRRTRPKQLLQLITERSLLLETVHRVAPALVPFDRIVIVCGAHLAGPIGQVVEPLGCRVLVEPMARNTAPCLGLAAAVVAETNPRGIMAVLAADHLIEDPDGFVEVLDRACDIATDGAIVTLGVTPTRPETGYGYVLRGEEVGRGAYKVDSFVEKPDLATAEAYLAHGGYDWNSGMFFMRADVLLDAINDNMPGLAAGLVDYRAAMGTDEEEAALVRCFEQAEALSIDYGVMEHVADNIVTVCCDVGWSDVGSWRTLLDHRDGDSNFVRGDTTLVDTKDSVVVSLGPHVAVIGAIGLAIVATPDAVLVTPLDRAQEVGSIAKYLKTSGHEELT